MSGDPALVFVVETSLDQGLLSVGADAEIYFLAVHQQIQEIWVYQFSFELFLKRA